jgi:hypothetical protein
MSSDNNNKEIVRQLSNISTSLRAILLELHRMRKAAAITPSEPIEKDKTQEVEEMEVAEQAAEAEEVGTA